MKKLLKFQTFAMLIALLSFGACQKESPTSTSDTPLNKVLQTSTSITAQNEVLETSPEATPIYTHNGQVISFESLDPNDDNIEVYAGYSINPNELLVFFNSQEVNTWLIGAPENIKTSIQKSREFTSEARRIATLTGAVQYFEDNGTLLPEYQIQMEQLSLRLYGNEGNSRGIGVIYENVNYSGNNYPVLGLGIGYPYLMKLDKKLNSVKILSITAVHTFTTKTFYRGTILIVSGWTNSVWSNTTSNNPLTGWIPALAAVTPLTVQFIGVLSDWGTLSPTGNKIRSYKGRSTVLG